MSSFQFPHVRSPIGENRFHVDKHSELYYDPTVLMEAVKKQTAEAEAEEQQQQQQQHPQHLAPQQMHQTNSRHHQARDYHLSSAHHQMGPPGHDPSMARHHPPPVNYPYPATSAANINMRGPVPMPNRQQYPGAPRGAPFNTAPPGQFYGGENASPMRMGPMGGMGMMDQVGVSGMQTGMGWDGSMPMNRMHN